jgi:hypothetical protein
MYIGELVYSLNKLTNVEPQKLQQKLLDMVRHHTKGDALAENAGIAPSQLAVVEEDATADSWELNNQEGFAEGDDDGPTGKARKSNAAKKKKGAGTANQDTGSMLTAPEALSSEVADSL